MTDQEIYEAFCLRTTWQDFIGSQEVFVQELLNSRINEIEDRVTLSAIWRRNQPQGKLPSMI